MNGKRKKVFAVTLPVCYGQCWWIILVTVTCLVIVISCASGKQLLNNDCDNCPGGNDGGGSTGDGIQQSTFVSNLKHLFEEKIADDEDDLKVSVMFWFVSSDYVVSFYLFYFDRFGLLSIIRCTLGNKIKNTVLGMILIREGLREMRLPFVIPILAAFVMRVLLIISTHCQVCLGVNIVNYTNGFG